MQVHQVLTDRTNLVQDSPDIFLKFICRGFLKIIFLLKLSIFFFSGLSLLSFALHEKELFWEFKRIGSLSLQISNIIHFEDCLSICAKEKYYNLRHLYGCIFTLPKTNMILSKLSSKFCLRCLTLHCTRFLGLSFKVECCLVLNISVLLKKKNYLKDFYIIYA